MNALSEFVREQMKLRGWVDKRGVPLQAELVRRSGLPKQLVSVLLGGREMRRMIWPETVTGLATAFALDGEDLADDGLTEQQSEKVRDWEQVIRLKSAEAAGVPVNQPPVIVEVEVPRKPTHDELVEFLQQLLQQVAGVDQTDTGLGPKPRRAVDDAGGLDEFSGETPTVGDPRSPGLRTRRSDADDPEAAPPRGTVSRLAS